MRSSIAGPLARAYNVEAELRIVSDSRESQQAFVLHEELPVGLQSRRAVLGPVADPCVYAATIQSCVHESWSILGCSSSD